MDWLPLLDPTHLGHVILSQLPTAPPSSPTLPQLSQDIELLKKHLELVQKTNQALSDGLTSQVNFLREENKSLTDSFAKFIEAMKWNFSAD
jgi:hypothetical protein